MSKQIRLQAVVFIVFATASACLAFVGSDAYNLKYQLEKGKTVRYAFESTMETIQEMMGSEQTSHATSSAQIKLTSEGVGGDGNLSFVMVYEAFSTQLTSAMFDTSLKDPEGLIGKRIQKVVAPNGDQIKSTELDSIALPPLLRQGFTTQQEFFQDLPTGALTEGKAVTVSDVDSVQRFGGNVVTKSTTEYTLAGVEKKHGYDCVKVKFTTTVSVEGEGSIQGMKFFLEGDGDVEGVMHFAPKEGILVSVDRQMDMESTAAITGQMNMTIPITQAIHMTLNIVE